MSMYDYPGYSHHHESETGYSEPIHHHHGYSWGVIIAVIIAIAIIVVIIWWFFFRNRPPQSGIVTNTNYNPPYNPHFSQGPWVFVQGQASATDTFTAGNNSIYRVSGVSSGLNLTLVAPANPVGQQFIIDNTQGAGNVTLNGVTVLSGTGNGTTQSNVVLRGRTAWFIWSSSTSVVRMT